MNAAGRLSLYAAGLVVTFAGAYGVAGAVVPQSVVDSWNEAAAMAGHEMGSDASTGASVEASASDEVDGFDLSIAGHLVSDTESEATVTVERDGQPVTLDAEPIARVLVLNTEDLTTVPLTASPTVTGAEITFSAAVPAAGRYALFVDFSVDGQVRTAQFALDAMSADDMDMGGS